MKRNGVISKKKLSGEKVPILLLDLEKGGIFVNMKSMGNIIGGQDSLFSTSGVLS